MSLDLIASVRVGGSWDMVPGTAEIMSMNAWGLTAEPSGLTAVGLLAADCGGSGTIEVGEGPPGLDWFGGSTAWALDTMIRSLGCNWIRGLLHFSGWNRLRLKVGERGVVVGRTRASIRSDNFNIPWL